MTKATVTAREQETCRWREEIPDSGIIVTACDRVNPPEATNFRFCPYCGKPLEITRLKGERA